MSMSSETEFLKTNEFLRRRKLRLQQVREQSKDIAKKIRQRAKVEKLRQICDLDSKKEKEYLQKQEKLVKRLEQLYAQGVKSVGESHKKASEERQNESSPEKDDLSKVRGKEAVAELRRRKQEKLDEQKKLLDRKLLAREAANEISREKSSSVANKLLAKSSSGKLITDADENAKESTNEDVPKVTRADMATQWDFEELPNEWEPNVPALSLHRDDKESVKDSNIAPESKSDKSKRLDLFALSAEMPSSLRGGIPNVTEDRSSIRPSLTLVSEYLQSRALRLRETDTTGSSKKQSDDLNNIKQTILRSRSSKIEGTLPSTSVCHVADDQVIPVPSWQAESNCEFCTHSILHHKQLTKTRQFTVTNSQINEIFSSIRPARQDLRPRPVVRGNSPFRRSKVCPSNCIHAAKGSIDKSTTSSGVETNLTKKNSVTMYNHSTRDSRDVPRGDSRLVVRDLQADEDAYSQALKETTNDHGKDREHQKKLQEMRNKVAMTKQTVEKEYIDTMSFLKSLPKEKCSKHVKNAYMDERQQRILKVSRQQKLQQEFNKIEKDCRKNCENARAKQTAPEKTRRKSKSPARADLDDDFESRDMQYSWMPVPESDGNLAIHTIPTTLKEGKTGNTVKFSQVDSYHEYRSRHKHTPPTKDTNNDRQSKRVVETVIIQKDDESTDCSSITSDASSVDNLNIGKNNDKVPDEGMSEADKIIIYKILDKKEKERKKIKLIDNVAKVLKLMDKEKLNKAVSDNNNNKEEKGNNKSADNDTGNKLPIDQIDEGVYKVVSEKGDNIASLYFSENIKAQEGRNIVITDDEQNFGRPCRCNKKLSESQKSDKGTNLHCGTEDRVGKKRTSNCLGCKCGCASNPTPQDQSNKAVNSTIQPSAATSTSSFKTATTDKAHSALPDGGYVKLLDDDGQEAGKFYIGASGFLKDDAYEVIIQLRKKEAMKIEHEKENTKNPQRSNIIDEERVLTIHDLKEGNTSDREKSNLVKEVIDNPESARKEDALDTENETPRVLPQTSSSHMNTNNAINESAEIDQNSSAGISTVSSNEPIPDAQPAKKLVDKGVHTSFQLSYAIPSHFPKEDFPRPATSTYTQTTMESPNPRPVFIHMSSSTSTAYMSPPEMVLPSFMRHEYDYQGEKLKMLSRNERCENEKCTRKRCKCHKTKSSSSCRSVNKVVNPPPNTARDNQDYNSDLHEDEFDRMNRKTHGKKRHRCASRTSSGKELRKENHRDSHNAPLNKISSRNLVMRVSSSTASSFKHKMNTLHSKKIGNKPDLNPVIKKYVNRLLELNRKGIKAVEVANQECSSVSTPGSSIIEVPRNLNNKESNVDNKLSLEQIKNILKQKILDEYVKENMNNNNSVQTLCSSYKSRTSFNKLPKKRSVHRVKSLNISKRLLKGKRSDPKCSNVRNTKTNPSTSSPSSAREVKSNKPEPPHIPNRTKSRSKSSPTPRQFFDYDHSSKNIESDISDTIELRSSNIRTKSNSNQNSNLRRHQPQVTSKKINEFSRPFHGGTTTSPDSELEALKRRQEHEAATNISTQTSQDLDSEINLMKLAEDKLQNMEKIADLTEKCTKRLSNLAKVLEEVRRNKSLAYSQISTSDTASDTEHKSDKNASVNNIVKQPYELARDELDNTDPRLSTTMSTDPERKLSQSTEYIPFLTDIPKPAEFKYPVAQSDEAVNTKPKPVANLNLEGMAGKRREKPPPALSRIHLKQGHDVIPHELSTVLEVDSPMSVKLRNQSSTNTKCEVSDMSFKLNNGYKDQKEINNEMLASTNTEHLGNPDLLQSNTSVSKPQNKISSTDSSDDSKMQMMDLKQFNELMLKPFISIQEFAKQCGGDLGALDDGSNLDDVPKDDGINDELSSLHSDGSLPDVIAELLKRNIITEPFKFDSVSNVNSTTVSSESMLSVLALSKVRKDKKKSSVVFQNKGNASETSDSLSISSNPDLENAFKKLGMGWASSTLKKTKERLALSSSSNTSSSSLSQFKLKCLNEQDIPVLVTDSVLSTTKLSSKKHQEKRSADTSKNAEQQTSFMNSMTVKEFLTNELAKKITFTNKSKNDTEDEFVSLFETKMPEEMKHVSQSIREERSIESVPSAQNNRARTSTPVQIFKSMTYHSSSSSNLSNGLFSNADDLSSVKVTSNSVRNHSTSDKDDLTIPNCSLKMRKGTSDCSKSE